jgi:hypothetical protein
MNLTIIATLALLLLNSASAFALSEDDKNAAIKAAENSELGGIIECGREMGNPIDLDIRPMDLNGLCCINLERA